MNLPDFLQDKELVEVLKAILRKLGSNRYGDAVISVTFEAGEKKSLSDSFKKEIESLSPEQKLEATHRAYVDEWQQLELLKEAHRELRDVVSNSALRLRHDPRASNIEIAQKLEKALKRM